MHFNTQLMAFVGLFASSALASDVYSTFYDGNGNGVSGTNFDIANTGCFSIPNAIQVSFSQGGVDFGNAQGPYCLYAYPSGGCSGNANTQQFGNVVVNDASTKYGLNDGVSNQPSYHWDPNAC